MREAARRMVSALGILYILQEYNTQFNADTAKILCQALLIQPDKKNKICYDYKGVLKHYTSYKK